MDVPAAGAWSARETDLMRTVRPGGASPAELRALRARWRAVSLASGWRFPGDWALPEVDAVCVALLGGVGRVETALAGLGRARAASGAGLAEVLDDLAALHAVLCSPDRLPDRLPAGQPVRAGGAHDPNVIRPNVDEVPARLLRPVAIGWADVAVDGLARTEVTDPLTGLPSAAYLRTRLGEIYRQAERERRCAAETHSLLVASLDLSASTGWARLTATILLADSMRTVFDGGESLAAIGPSTVAALVPREGPVSAGGVLLRRELTERLAVDSGLHEIGRPRISVLRLPQARDAALRMLGVLARS